MKSRKWFVGISNLQQLKARYKELVKVHHPDCGGDELDMKEINSEYDELFRVLPEVAKDGSTYKKPEDQQKERPEDFRNAMAAIIRFEDIEIEVCGDWIWLHGNTFAHKATIKEAGYFYSSNKKAWYWHDADYKRRHSKQYSMEDIRIMYGSETVQTKEQEKITA